MGNIIKKILVKITLFDLLVVGVLIIVGGSLYVFFKRSVDEVSIRVKVTDQDVLYARNNPAIWYANRIQVGDMEKDSLGRTLSVITGVEKFNILSDRQAVYVDIKLKAVYDKRKGVYASRGRNLVFGTPVRFGFSNVVFDGIVTEFPGSQDQTNFKVGKATVGFLQREVEPATAMSIKSGDKIYDSNGRTLVELKSITVKNSERVVTTDRGDLLLKKDPLFKDVEGVVEIATKTYNREVYIFDDRPLKVGEILPLNFGNVSLFPLITNFDLE